MGQTDRLDAFILSPTHSVAVVRIVSDSWIQRFVSRLAGREAALLNCKSPAWSASYFSVSVGGSETRASLSALRLARDSCALSLMCAYRSVCMCVCVCVCVCCVCIAGAHEFS